MAFLPEVHPFSLVKYRQVPILEGCSFRFAVIYRVAALHSNRIITIVSFQMRKDTPKTASTPIAKPAPTNLLVESVKPPLSQAEQNENADPKQMGKGNDIEMMNTINLVSEGAARRGIGEEEGDRAEGKDLTWIYNEIINYFAAVRIGVCPNGERHFEIGIKQCPRRNQKAEGNTRSCKLLGELNRRAN